MRVERRGFVTLTLCILFTLVYFKFLAPPPPPAKGDGQPAATSTDGTKAPANGTASDSGATDTQTQSPAVESGTYAATNANLAEIRPFENEALRVEFTNRGAGVRQIYLREYFANLDAKIARRSDPSGWVKLFRDDPTKPHRPALAVRELARPGVSPRWKLDEVLWEVAEEKSETGNRVVVFRYDAADGTQFEKRIECLPGRHWLKVTLKVGSRDPGHRGNAIDLLVTAADGIKDLERGQFTDPPKAFFGVVDRYNQATVTAALGSALAEEPRDVTGGEQQKIAFVGAGNLYFAAMLRPETLGDAIGGSLRGAEHDVEAVSADMQLFLRIPHDGGMDARAMRMFGGPKSKSLFLAEDLASFEPLIELDYGWGFHWINKLLLVILNFFHGLTTNWGVAVVLLTLVLRVSMFPVTRMQQVSMQKYSNQMMVLKPKLDQLRERYKDNAQRFAQEQMKLLKEHQVRPPVVGCLTSFITIPVFVAMFQILRSSIDLRHAGFVGWIHDLSLPDALFVIPGIHINFNVLPLLATGAFLWQMSLAPKPSDPQAQQQQKIMMIMPVVFGVMFYNYAAGLSLYMLVSSLYGIFESKVIRKRFFPLPPAAGSVAK